MTQPNKLETTYVVNGVTVHQTIETVDDTIHIERRVCSPPLELILINFELDT